jgi:hypothetical protein
MRKRLKCLYPNVNASLTSGIKPYEVRFDATAVAAEGPMAAEQGRPAMNDRPARAARTARQGAAGNTNVGSWPGRGSGVLLLRHVIGRQEGEGHDRLCRIVSTVRGELPAARGEEILAFVRFSMNVDHGALGIVAHAVRAHFMRGQVERWIARLFPERLHSHFLGDLPLDPQVDLHGSLVMLGPIVRDAQGGLPEVVLYVGI